MHHRHRVIGVIAALIGTVALAAPTRTAAQVEGFMRPAYAKLRTTAAADTVYVGHSYTSHNPANNYWNIYTGTCRPGRAVSNNALWDLENFTGIPGPADSLQGWWPIRLPYRGTGDGVGPVVSDDSRPWWCLDYGNQVNYAPLPTGRTRGVVGVWHSDPGAYAGNPLVRWAPLSGGRSAWCGLRALGDLTVVDPITANPFNESVAELNTESANSAPAPTFHNYPGYGNQWDQMLYRDLALPTGQPLTLSFLLRTRLSTGYDTNPATRSGWFHGDPLGGPAPGNLISSTDSGSNAPRDSFSVYIGVPVDDSQCLYSDGTVNPVYDRQRRWFDEVIRIWDTPYLELLGVAGNVPPDTAAVPASFSLAVPWTSLAPLFYAPTNPQHLVRIVFRVKTNREYSDEDFGGGNGTHGHGWSSYGEGAAILDDIKVDTGGGPVLLGDFESPTGPLSIDNSVATSPASAWKSTGKPPAAFFHPMNVFTMRWSSVCGVPGAQAANCDMQGTVLDGAFAGQGYETVIDARFPAMAQVIHGVVSPTISLATPYEPNPMGITNAIKQATDDYYIRYDVYTGAFVAATTGTTWNFGVQCYPALAANGHACWSDIVRAPFSLYQGFSSCEADLQALRARGMIHTSAQDGVPDSLRLYLGIVVEDFTIGGHSSFTDETGAFDNVALAIVNRADGNPGPGSITADLWQGFDDAFPVNGLSTDNVMAGTAAFDTTTALVKGAMNIAPYAFSTNRPDVLADSIVVCAPNAVGTDRHIRVDLVFRILPGPGNYKVASGRQFPPVVGMNLLRQPTDQNAVVTVPPAFDDPSFWAGYITHPGRFASTSAHHGGQWWDYLTWNSARCDTAEINLFPVVGQASSGVDPEGLAYMSTYWDPVGWPCQCDVEAWQYEHLGIAKPRCFLIDTTRAAVATNIACDSIASMPWLTTVPRVRTGWNGVYSTKEFTKIIPDGLLTPGSHVQYFFRKSLDDDPGVYAMVPDTTTILPQPGESDFDGHRWQSFGVLPDRWKGAEFGGKGMASLLYIENADRRGEELAWDAITDSTGGTDSLNWGQNSGWHARGGAGVDLDARSNPAGISTFYVSGKNRQPGTHWDRYQVKAAESFAASGARIGNRYAPQPIAWMAGKQAAIGPRMEWLRTYYRAVDWLTGDLNAGMVGPGMNVGEDDLSLIKDFLATPIGTPQPRALVAEGSGFAELASSSIDDYGFGTFLHDYLFCTLVAGDYSSWSTNTSTWLNLTTLAPYSARPGVYGIINDATPCGLSQDDVLDPVVQTYDHGVATAAYDVTGGWPHYWASALHQPSVYNNWLTQVNGWRRAELHNPNPVGGYAHTSSAVPASPTSARLAYYYDLESGTLGSVLPAWGPPDEMLDVPSAPPRTFVEALRIGNSVARSAWPSVRFGVAETERVRVRLYDVTGRAVRTLADRVFTAGDDHVLVWDGTNDEGCAVPRGVYFLRLDYGRGTRLSGRIVILH